MLHRKFVYLLGLTICFFLAGCYRVSYLPHGLTYFTLASGGKSEILTVLDEYAELKGFVKTQDGGEYLTEEAADIVMRASYKSKNDFSYSVSNFSNYKCFSLAAYDRSKVNSDKATKIAMDLKKELADVFAGQITFFESQGCTNET
jgi:hypothetical protein